MSNTGPEFASQIAELAERNEFAIPTLQFAAILPTAAISWPWLHEMVSVRFVHLGFGDRWQEVQTALEQSKLLVTASPAEFALLAEGVADFVLGAIDASERILLTTELRVVAARRIKQFKNMKHNLLDNAMRAANGGAEVTAWTVPSADKVATATAGDPAVKVLNNGDGSYSVAVDIPAKSLWEDACISRFCTAMVSSNSLDDIEFVLRTPMGYKFGLENARSRIEQLCHASTTLQSDVVRGLLSLNLAHMYASSGSWRGATHRAGEAYKLFDKLRREHPQSIDLTSLFEESLRCAYVYDD
jgi:hypothetical protein